MAQFTTVTLDPALLTPGHDVSIWQDDQSTPQVVDFKKMRQAGSKFVGIKVSQGIWLDGDYIENWGNAKAVGQPRMGYHFYDWCRTPVEQARFFAKMLKNDPGEILPVDDYEMREGAPERKAAIAAQKVFFQEAESALGKKLMMYTSLGMWGQYGDPDDPFWGERLLWLAQYRNGFTVDIPAPWTRETLAFWQWGSQEDGPKYGAESELIDANYYNGTEAQMVQRFGIKRASDWVEEPDQPTTGVIVAPAGVRFRAEPYSDAAQALPVGTKVTIIERRIVGADTWIKTNLNLWLAETYQGKTLIKVA